MPRIGCSITKSTGFRGAIQEFSNVYYYEVGSLPSQAEADTFIDTLTATEKTFHATSVTFVRGRLWSETGNKATSEMISQKNLSGAGARASISAFDPERAFLFRLRAGNDSRGNPVYLRKYYHSNGQFTGTVITSATHLSQAQAYTGTEKAAFVSQMNAIGDNSGSPLVARLCAKGGRLPGAGATWEAHSWLEHHQLGDMWRAN